MRSDACSLVWEGRVLCALKFGALMREGLRTSAASISPVWGVEAQRGQCQPCQPCTTTDQIP